MRQIQHIIRLRVWLLLFNFPAILYLGFLTMVATFWGSDYSSRSMLDEFIVMRGMTAWFSNRIGI